MGSTAWLRVVREIDRHQPFRTMRSGAAHQSDGRPKDPCREHATGRCVFDNPADVSRRFRKVHRQQTDTGVRPPDVANSSAARPKKELMYSAPPVALFEGP